MNVLNLSLPQNDSIIAAGFSAMRVSKSSTGSAAGPYTALTPDLTLQAGTTAYIYVDVMGITGDWYVTQYVQGGTVLSSMSTPEPSYLSDLLNTIRDLLGVTTNEAPDSLIVNYSYLPLAFSRLRGRLSTFDATIYAGGDKAQLCLGALSHYTAALLCPRMTVAIMDAEQFKDYKYQRNRQLDWNATAQALMSVYEEMISLASGETSSNSAVYVTGILMANPRLGGSDTSGGLSQFSDPAETNPLLPYDQHNLP